MTLSSIRTERRRRCRRIVRQLIYLLMVFFLNCHAVIADSNGERRASVGLNLFRALLIANQDAEQRLSNAGEIPVYILYVDDPLQADQYRDTLAESLQAIRDTRVSIKTLSLTEYMASEPPALGLFMSQRLREDELAALMRRTISQKQTLFSPFEGDVERGVMAGISVQASVRPYINVDTLKRSGVHIKPFYLKVAKLYE